MKAGIYIHIPFCASKCKYCDFYSVADLNGQEQYTNMVLREIARYKGQGIQADTLFFGGGTPSLMEPSQISRMLDACREAFCLEGEVTLEANPDSVCPESLAALREAGVNRISFGAQSAVDPELKFLGRRHDAERIAGAVREAQAAGFRRISLDVMLGIPLQTQASLQYTLEVFTALGVEHLSAYLLKIEEGTRFDRENAARFCPNEDETAELYLQAVRTLEEKGFRQYEISNFSRPGGECRHNLKYWKLDDYIGIGPAAHSLLHGRRFYHPRGLAEYLSAGGGNFEEEGPGGDLEERFMLGMRLTEGVMPAELGLPEESCRMLQRRADRYRKAGYLQQDEGRLRFTPEGFLVSNAILADLLGAIITE